MAGRRRPWRLGLRTDSGNSAGEKAFVPFDPVILLLESYFRKITPRGKKIPKPLNFSQRYRGEVANVDDRGRRLTGSPARLGDLSSYLGGPLMSSWFPACAPHVWSLLSCPACSCKPSAWNPVEVALLLSLLMLHLQEVAIFVGVASSANAPLLL